MANRKRKDARTGAFGSPKSHRDEAALSSSRDYTNRAMDKAGNGDHHGAFSDAERAVEKDPKDGAAYLNRGRANHALGRYEQAIADFTEALRCPYNSFFSRTWFLCFCWWDRADSQVALGNLAAALTNYNRAIDLGLDIPGVYYNRGHCHAELGNLAAALTDYNRAIDLGFDDPEVYHNRGHCHAELGNLAAALTDYNRAIDLGFDDPEVYHNRGHCHAELGNLAAALTNYNRAIDLNPVDALAHCSRGHAKFSLKDYSGATVDYGHAIILFGDSDSDLTATAHYNMGLSKTLLGNPSEAIADFSRFIDLAPDDPDGHYQRGSCRVYCGDFEGAINDCIRAMSLNSDLSVNCLVIIGFAKGWEQNYDEAFAAYDEAISLNPNFVPIYYHRGITEASRDNHDSALANFNQVVELDNDHPYVYLQRGLVRATLYDYDGAIADYNKAMALDPDLSSRCYILRAVANLRQGDEGAAKSDCELAGFDNLDSLLVNELGQMAYSMTESAEFATSYEPPASEADQLLAVAEADIAKRDAEIERLKLRLAESETETKAEREKAIRAEEQLEATKQQFRLVYGYKSKDTREPDEPKTTIASAEPYQIHYYIDSNGSDLFNDWLGAVSPADQKRIRDAIDHMKQGNLSDAKALRRKSGLFERRLVHTGLRIYYWKDSATSLLILGGGTKSDQVADIDKAVERLTDHKQRRSGPAAA